MNNLPIHTGPNGAFPNGDLWNITLGLDLPLGARLIHDDRTEQNVIELEDSVPYPNLSDAGRTPATRAILLEPLPDGGRPRRLLVPDNTTTLVTVLNEAAGTTDSFEVSPDESRTVALLTGLFQQLGAGLLSLARDDGLLPRSLEYSQVLVVKDTYGCKLLPPLSLEPVSNRQAERMLQWARIGRTLNQSLASGADTPAHRHLASLLGKVVEQVFSTEEL